MTDEKTWIVRERCENRTIFVDPPGFDDDFRAIFPEEWQRQGGRRFRFRTKRYGLLPTHSTAMRVAIQYAIDKARESIEKK